MNMYIFQTHIQQNPNALANKQNTEYAAKKMLEIAINRLSIEMTLSVLK